MHGLKKRPSDQKDEKTMWVSMRRSVQIVYVMDICAEERVYH